MKRNMLDIILCTGKNTEKKENYTDLLAWNDASTNVVLVFLVFICFKWRLSEQMSTKIGLHLYAHVLHDYYRFFIMMTFRWKIGLSPDSAFLYRLTALYYKHFLVYFWHISSIYSLRTVKYYNLITRNCSTKTLIHSTLNKVTAYRILNYETQLMNW